MTQKEQILEYLHQYKEITPIIAFEELYITKLATRISELRKDGVEINGEWIESVNKFGQKIRFMRYTLAA